MLKDSEIAVSHDALFGKINKRQEIGTTKGNVNGRNKVKQIRYLKKV